MLKIEYLTLRGYVDLQSTADFGPTLEYKGHMLKRLAGFYDHRYVSVFGEITISGTVYGTLPTQKYQLVPLDSIVS